MKVNILPFLLVFLSALVPAAGSLFNVPVYHAPAALVIGAIAVTAALTRRPLTVNNAWIISEFAFLFFILTIQIFTGRGFVTLATGGYVLVFAFVFYSLFMRGAGASVGAIVRGVSFMYQFFVVGMIIEMFLLNLGMQPVLRALMSSSASPNYKIGNPSDAARLLGLLPPGTGGLNSILLGSQIAGMLSLFAAIWFIGLKTWQGERLGAGHSGLWIFLSLFLLLVTTTATVFVLLIAAVVIYGVVINRKYRVLSFIVISASLVGVYFLVFSGYLFPRIFNERLLNLQSESLDPRLADQLQGITTTGYYIFEFYTPIANFISASFVDKLIGVGAEFLRTTSSYQSGDFGFGAALLSSGAVWMAVLMASVLGICYPALRGTTSRSPDQKCWASLASANGLIALLWLFSTVHYNQAFANPGGMTLFALHLALTMYCRERFRGAPKLSFDSRRMPALIVRS